MDRRRQRAGNAPAPRGIDQAVQSALSGRFFPFSKLRSGTFRIGPRASHRGRAKGQSWRFAIRIKRTPSGPGLEGCRIGSKTRAKTTVWSDYLDDPCNQGKTPKLPKGWTFSFKTLDSDLTVAPPAPGYTAHSLVYNLENIYAGCGFDNACSSTP